LYYRKSDCVILVFDVMDYNIAELEGFVREYKEKGDNNDTIFYLVGNKIDLKETKEEMERIVKNQQLLELSEKYSMTYFLVSAITGDYIRDLFDDIHRSLLKIDTTNKHPQGLVSLETGNENKVDYRCCYITNYLRY